MIVINEEENIRKCLTKVSQFVDEIILVDTGSTDNTKAVASEFTSKVYDFKWCNDFAAARNFSISKAQNDWILILDADEWVSQFSCECISKFINDKNNEKTVGRIERINILEDENKRCKERVNRLFNRKNFRYDGTIHEQIVSIHGTAYNTAAVEIYTYHTGYTNESITKTNKLNRNKDMLTKAIEDKPDDPYLFYQLGKTNYMMKDYNTASICFEKALSYQLDFRLEYVEDLIETYFYALINSSRYSDAMNIERYLDLYRNSPDFHFILGLVYMNNAKFTLAVESFLECTRLSNGKMDGITTFLPFYNIGVIYEVLGYSKQAIEYYSMCSEYNPAMERLRKLQAG
jgi:glycosyltransferase involved in cell wall biosynthesis